jgi:hypothetical protein
MTAHGPVSQDGTPVEADDGGEPEDRTRRLEQLRRRARQLERQRIAVGPSFDRARLVALDVELCRVEAATRMLSVGEPLVDACALLPAAGGPPGDAIGPWLARGSSYGVVSDRHR